MIISSSPQETVQAGERCGRNAQAGEVFALRGDLGAGKTQFVKGFVRGMGSEAEVTSPTFTLLHEYTGGRCPVYHFDFYRLDSTGAVARLGLDEYLYGDGVCVIEWADRFPELLPRNTIAISIVAENQTRRTIEGVPLR